MASIKLSSFITSISGTVGGHVFQNSASGFTIKNKPQPINMRTSKQVASRALLAQLSSAWLSLSSSQVAAWNDYNYYLSSRPASSTAHFISGRHLFIRFNSYRVLSGFSILTDFNFRPALPAIYKLSCEKITNQLKIFFYPTDLTSGYLPIIFASSPVLPSKTFLRTNLRFMKPTSIAFRSASIQGTYLSTFGRYPADHEELYVAGRIAYLDTPYISSEWLEQIVCYYQ